MYNPGSDNYSESRIISSVADLNDLRIRDQRRNGYPYYDLTRNATIPLAA